MNCGGFTFYKNHITPYGDRSFTRNKRNRVNCGVMLCRASSQSKSFFKEFASVTRKFVEEKNPLNDEFLAPDQDAFMWILSNEGQDWEQPYSAKFDLDGDFTRRGSNSLKVKPFSRSHCADPVPLNCHFWAWESQRGDIIYFGDKKTPSTLGGSVGVRCGLFWRYVGGGSYGYNYSDKP